MKSIRSQVSHLLAIILLAAMLLTACHPVIMIPILIVLACLVALACTAGIRGRLVGVARRPIVENIREL